MTRFVKNNVFVDERGSTMLTMLFFLLIMFGLLSLLLLAEQASVTEMRMQQTADLITKGARAAGTWEYQTPSGRWRKRLIATSEEAERLNANIVRGSREEAEILYQLNKSALHPEVNRVWIHHQNGEEASLYTRGIYRVALYVENEILLIGQTVEVLFHRISQSGVYDG